MREPVVSFLSDVAIPIEPRWFEHVLFGSLSHAQVMSFYNHSHSFTASLSSWARLAAESEPGIPGPADSAKDKDGRSPPPRTTSEMEDLGSVIDAVWHIVAKPWGDQSHHPRGLANPGHSCYMNAVLQTLVGGTPLIPVFKEFPYYAKLPMKRLPHIRAMVQFVRLFQTGEGGLSSSITPTMFYELAGFLGPSSPLHTLLQNAQEDAAEFLTHLLDMLHEEMLASALVGAAVPVEVEEATEYEQSDADSWSIVGGKGQQLVALRRTSSSTLTTPKSPVSQVFGGTQHIIVRKQGEAAGTVDVQPFYVLGLRIVEQHIDLLEIALKEHCQKTDIEGFMSETLRGVEIQCSQQHLLGTLPKVLYIQLQRFLYWGDGCEKIGRFVSFPLVLQIPLQCLAAGCKEQRRIYHLRAVVTHIGAAARSGHYIADVLYGKSWLNFDDHRVTKEEQDVVLKRPAYLLMYVQV